MLYTLYQKLTAARCSAATPLNLLGNQQEKETKTSHCLSISYQAKRTVGS